MLYFKALAEYVFCWKSSKKLSSSSSSPSRSLSFKAPKTKAHFLGAQLQKRRENYSKGHLPRCTVYPESLHRDLRILQVNTVCQEGLNIVKVLRFQFGHRGETVVVLFNKVCHEFLIKCQFMIPSNHYFIFIWQVS